MQAAFFVDCKMVTLCKPNRNYETKPFCVHLRGYFMLL
jgi:hypothetical protein